MVLALLKRSLAEYKLLAWVDCRRAAGMGRARHARHTCAFAPAAALKHAYSGSLKIAWIHVWFLHCSSAGSPCRECLLGLLQPSYSACRPSTHGWEQVDPGHGMGLAQQ